MSEPALMPTNPDSPGWVSIVGIRWVLDDAPCPAELLSTLLAIARRAGADGKGSRQSAATIAAKVGKSAAQVKKEIRALRDKKLLVLGNQALVAKIPAGQRPVVYDLPLDYVGAKPMRESRNKTGKKKINETGSFQATGALEATGSSGATPPVASEVPEGELASAVTGSSEAPQRRSEEDLEEEVQEEDQTRNPLGLTEPGDAPAANEQGETTPSGELDQTAHELAMVYRPQLSGVHFGMLRGRLITALHNGWTRPALAELLAGDQAGVVDLGKVLIARVRDNPEPPPPVDPALLVPCPIEGHYDYHTGQQQPALACTQCWSHVRVGEDPYGGQHARRPTGWVETYGLDPQPLEPPTPMSADERAAMMASVTELQQRLGLGEAMSSPDVEVSQ